jgi:hypothetical protein
MAGDFPVLNPNTSGRIDSVVCAGKVGDSVVLIAAAFLVVDLRKVLDEF